MPKPGVSTSEGRANLARPSLCLLSLLLAGALLTASVASAATPTPVLFETLPDSPGIDLSPLVVGDSTGAGVIPTRVHLSSLGPIRLAGEGEEEATIFLYLDSKCSGPVAGEGTAKELDKNGIPAQVKPEQVNFIYARQVDPLEGPSGCSNPLKYEHVKELPPPAKENPSGEGLGGLPAGPGSPPVGGSSATRPDAPHLRTVPGGRANDNTPIVTGAAPGAGTVKVFANPNCDGAPAAEGTADQLASGLGVRVADNSVTEFSGMAIASGSQSSCSASVIYIEDSTAPRTRITMGPGVKTRKHKAVFRFADTTEDPPGTTFLCKVNHRKWMQCNSPFKMRHLRAKRYLVRVKAVDSVGNAEAKGAKRRFKVVH